MTVVSEEPRVEELLELYERMALIRATEKAAFDLFMAELVKGTTHLANGQEAVAVGASAALEADDYVFAAYRGHHHAIAEKAGEELPGRADESGHRPVRGQGRLHAPDRRRPQHARVVRHRQGASADRLRGRLVGQAAGHQPSRGGLLRRQGDLISAFHKASTWPRCGSCRSCSSARTTCT